MDLLSVAASIAGLVNIALGFSRTLRSSYKAVKDTTKDTQEEHQLEVGGLRPPAPIRPTPVEVSLFTESPSYKFFPSPSKTGQTISEWSSEYLATTRDEANFLAFPSLYGPNGVPLRELIMLATLRASFELSGNHWLSGEIGPIFRAVGDASLPTDCSFLNAFVRETSDSFGIDALQERLVSMRLLVVEPATGRSSSLVNGTLTSESGALLAP